MMVKRFRNTGNGARKYSMEKVFSSLAGRVKSTMIEMKSADEEPRKKNRARSVALEVESAPATPALRPKGANL